MAVRYSATLLSCPGGYYCPVEGTGGEEAPGPTGISLLKCPMHMYAPQPKDTGDQIEPGAVQCTPCMEGQCSFLHNMEIDAALRDSHQLTWTVHLLKYLLLLLLVLVLGPFRLMPTFRLFIP